MFECLANYLQTNGILGLMIKAKILLDTVRTKQEESCIQPQVEGPQWFPLKVDPGLCRQHLSVQSHGCHHSQLNDISE